MKVEKTNFGKIENDVVSLYELSNDHGTVVKVADYGATITAISTADAKGKTTEITCGFDNISGYFSKDYKENAPYFGGTVGRHASRISEGKFSLEGKEYSVVGNDRGNHLHGGTKGFDKRMWTVEEFKENDQEVTLVLSLQSKDMEEGYPGNVAIKTRFTLNNTNELHISYEAHTDKATPLSLTNHSYFNLSGFEETIHNHQVAIHSEAFLKVDEKGIPLGGTIDVANKPEDLRTAKPLQVALDKMETGFEHYYLFEKDFKLKKIATFEHPESGRGMEIATTEPGMLLYTGYFTSDALKRENGDKFGRYKGFCCETHRYPDGPNIKDAPKSITTPEAPYTSKTVFKFYTVK